MENQNNLGKASVLVQYEVNKKSTEQLDKSLKDTEKKVEKSTGAFSKSFSKVALTIGIVTAAVTKLATSTMNAYKVQAVAETKLETVMKRRMAATDEQIQKIKDLASEYQNLGLVGDEVALAGLSQLSMYTKQVSSLEKLLPDFENALVGLYGTDATASNAQSLATQIGKALGNGKVSGLARMGVVFTEAEQKAFAVANETERISILSAKLNNTFGNINKELAKTPTGRIAQLKNQFSDLKETLGQAFTNIFASLVPILSTIISYLSTIAQKLVTITEKVYTAFGGVIKATGGAVGSVEDLAGAYEDVGSAAGGANESLASFDNTVQLADSSGGGGASGAGGLEFEPQELIDNKELEKSVGLIDRIKRKFDDIKKDKSFIKLENIKKNIDSIVNYIRQIFDEVKPNAEGFVTAFVESIKAHIHLIIAVAIATVDAFIAGIKKSIEENKPHIIDDLKAIFDNLGTFFDNLAAIYKIVEDIIVKFLELETTVGFISNIITIVTNVFNGILRLVTDIIAYITTRVRKFLEDHQEEIDRFLQSISGFLYEVSETVKIIVNKVIDSVKQGIAFIKPIIDFFADHLDNIIATIMNILSGVFDFLKGFFEWVNGMLTGDHAKALNGLVDMVKGVGNSIISFIEGMINGVITSINWMIQQLNKIKIPGTDIGININEIRRVSIKRLKDGGIVYKPTDFGNYMAGEAGAEAIVPLQNSNYTKQLASEIVKGMKDAGLGGGDIFNIENAFGDSRAMERLVDKIEDVRKRKNSRNGGLSYGY